MTTRLIEKQWVTSVGYPAEVVADSAGFRCGYVTVPDDHPCAGKGYDEIDVAVHGGLTYAAGTKFGFDCAHWDDARDRTLMDEGYRKIYEDMPDNPYSTVKTLEFCVDECEKLAAQLKEKNT
jgi:hypothetical protein